MAIGPIVINEYNQGDLSWLGSRHAVAEAHPGTLDAAAFASAEGVENGVVPSGYPLVTLGDKYGPYTGGESEVLSGFSIYDRDITHGDVLTAVHWHGRVRPERLPIDFDAPENPGAFVFE